MKIQNKYKAIGKKLFLFLKIIVSASLLIYLLLQVDWEKTFTTINNANIFWLFAAAFLSVLDIILLTYKWNLLLKVRGKLISFWRLFTINMIGGFWGLFLPSSLGTDVVRGFYLFKSLTEKAICVTSIFVDRFLAMLALFTFVSLALVYSDDFVRDLNLDYYIYGFILLSAVSLYLITSNTFNHLENLLEKLSGANILNKIKKIRSSLLEYSKYPGTLIYSFLVSLFIQFERVVWYIVIAWAFGVDVPLIYYFIFCPIIIVILMIPVSIGGLGVREGSFVALFTMIGMKIDDAVIISFTSSLLTYLFTISGALFYLFSNVSNSKLDIGKIELNQNSV